MRLQFYYVILIALVLTACQSGNKPETTTAAKDSLVVVMPVLVTDSVKYDSDDPAIWINNADPANSLILGTDKGGDTGDGAIFVFDLNGKEIREKTIRNIKRPNNVDIAYGFDYKGAKTDIAVCTERNTNSIRVFSLPDMKPIDGGGIPVFEDDSLRLPMGISLYTNSNNIYAIVSRKNGPSGSYLYQYLLKDINGKVTGQLLRKFGNYSGKHEIEAVAVDNKLGFIYYSDEGTGVRKYYAHPDSSNAELAFFGTTGFADNHEGISIYKTGDSTGYIVVSDQQANQFQIFSREGVTGNPHDHRLLKVVKTSAVESDGNEVTSSALPGFPKGFLIAMSDDRTFQIFRWGDIMEKPGY